MKDYRPLMVRCRRDNGNYKKGNFGMMSSSENSITGEPFLMITKHPLSSSRFDKQDMIIFNGEPNNQYFELWSVMNVRTSEIIRCGDVILGRKIKSIDYIGDLCFGRFDDDSLLCIDDYEESLKTAIEHGSFFIDENTVLLRKGYPRSLYKIGIKGSTIFLFNMVTQKKFKIEHKLPFLEPRHLKMRFTENEFSRILPSFMKINDFKPLDILDIYSNCKDL